MSQIGVSWIYYTQYGVGAAVYRVCVYTPRIGDVCEKSKNVQSLKCVEAMSLVS